MSSISNCVQIRKGRLGTIVQGQRGKWYGSKPPLRESGDICKFSSASRKRLRETICKANPRGEGWHCFGVCLTIPGRILTPDEVRRLWHEFISNSFKRKFELPLIWRIELQERKQAHWHCVIWANDAIRVNDGWYSPDLWLVGHEWRRIVRRLFGPFDERTDYGFDHFGVKIQSIEESSSSGIVGYLADHTSKHKQAQLGWRGRQWGVVNRHLLTFETEVLMEVSEFEHKQAARQFRRLQERLRKRGGKYTGVRVTPAGDVSTTIFGNDEKRLMKCYAMVTRKTSETGANVCATARASAQVSDGRTEIQMFEHKASINERINPHGWSPHDPVLRWIPGRAAETLRVEFEHDQPSAGYTGECDYSDPYGVWGDDGTRDMLDRPITDAEWVRLLECVEIV